MSITEARKELVDFSIPYFTVERVIVTRAESPLGGVDDLAGKVAVVIEGSSHEEHLRKLGLTDDDFLFVGFTLECFTAVANGDADYTLADSSAAAQQLRSDPSLEVAFALPGKDDYGLAVPKNSPDLLAELDAFITEQRESGALDEIIGRHLKLD